MANNEVFPGDHPMGRNPNEDRADWYGAETPWGPEPVEVLGGVS